MKYDRLFFRCELCGNIVEKIEDGGMDVVCCKKDMTRLVANTTDAAQEKHVPDVKRENGKLIVTIGSVPHPMTEEHHIAWIIVAGKHTTQRVMLDHTGKPTATFVSDESPVTVYEYCNLHGLWAVDA